MRNLVSGFAAAAMLWLAPAALAQCVDDCGRCSAQGSCCCDVACVGIGDCCPDAATECPIQHSAGTFCADGPDTILCEPENTRVIDSLGRCQSASELCGIPAIVESCTEHPERCGVPSPAG
ncbi:MAG: hypothetical protein ACREQ9_23470 [Candidatus Binatia bacterium]